MLQAPDLTHTAPLWHMAVSGLAGIVALALLAWLLSLWIRDVSIIDSFWSVFIATAGAVYVFTAAAITPRAQLMLGIVLLWALRLCIYLTWRNHGQPEDRRYQQIRARNQPNFEFKSLYLVFGLQAVLAWLVAMPLLAAARSGTALNALDVVGAVIAVCGVIIEAMADQQMAAFKADVTQRGQVMDRGWWRYSRHPNYFGECLVWWGVFLIALAGGHMWYGNVWCVISPLLITVLLVKISGVPLLEGDIAERRPAYRDYIARTSSLVPWPPTRPPTGSPTWPPKQS